MRRAVAIVVGLALIVDGLTGWATDVVAVVVGAALVAGVGLDALVSLARTPPAAADPPPREPWQRPR